MKNRKSLVIGILCLTLVFMGIGYSLFSTTLNITGSSQSSGSFDVKITNIEVDSNNTSSGASDAMDPIGENYAVTETTLVAEFNAPGDYITYNITVTNRGSIDAVISVETNMLDSTDWFTLTCDVDEGEEVAAGDYITFPCTMTFNEDVDDLSNITTAHMTVSLKAVQKATYTPPAQVCYTPLQETKTLGVISGNTKTPVSTVGVNNIQVGDLVGYGTSDIDSNEQFYVIENDNGTLKLLSRYDINLGPHQKPWDNCSRDTRGYQDKTISFTRTNVNNLTNDALESLESEFIENGYLYGSMQFYDADHTQVAGYWWDTTNNTFDTTSYPLGTSEYPFVYDSNSYIKQFVDQYRTNLTALGLTGITNATVISLEELRGLCNWNSNDEYDNCPNYIFETSYWLGSAVHRHSIWLVSAQGLLGNNPDGFDFNLIYGVRPVITITLN